MKHLKLLCMLLTAILAAVFCIDASAQFKEEAFTQQYNDDTAADSDTTDVLFSFKEYFGGLRHEKPIRIGTMTAGSALIIGGSQIYNRQTWKLPIVYGAIGGSLGAGIYLNASGNKEAAKYCFIGAGVAYWATLMDGVINFRPNDYPHPGTATLYSLLLPGLGQIYNREYWKLPIYLGAIGFAVHYYADCQTNYLRFKRLRTRTWNTPGPSPPTRRSTTATSIGATGTIPSWPSPSFICCRSSTPTSFRTCTILRWMTTSPSKSPRPSSCRNTNSHPSTPYPNRRPSG